MGHDRRALKSMKKTARLSSSKADCGGGAIQSPAERFFNVAKTRPSHCLTGAVEAVEALKLYSVAELLVARPACAPPHPPVLARTCSAGWEAWASEHKVKLIWINPDTDQGRRFCRGVGVAALLTRPIDQTMLDAMTESLEDYGISSAMVIERMPNVAPPAVPAPSLTHHTAAKHEEDFFHWLRRALSRELDDCSAEAMLACAEVILADVSNEDEDVRAQQLLALQDVIMECGAPMCAEELAARWYAVMMP